MNTKQSKNAPKPSKTTKKTVVSKQREAEKLRRRAAVYLSEWQIVTWGMSDESIAHDLRVPVATVTRWRRGTTLIPWMAMEIMRQRRGMSLPGAYEEFEDFIVMRGHEGAVLVPPGAHWKDGITAREVRNWWLLRQIVSSALFRKRPRAELPAVPAHHLMQPAANDSAKPMSDVIPFPL
ncbi:hypothetical protein VI06_11590 [Aquitalea magnusonii]|nr:hypothetical protein VI06_11590 [Aquitalea magnusonii]